ncbi:MAG: PhnD/SsuA/transferrin family substrate-binding protein [Pseudomonadales bacterium]|nr:PhnD/SsuA/transferrin family substrate-binding protein [Pseudomonadales bacterium]
MSSYLPCCYAETDRLDTIRFLHIPLVSRALTRQIYAPIALELKQNLGIKLEIFFTSNYCDLLQLAHDPSQSFDLVFPPPHAAAQLSRQLGYIPIVYFPQQISGVFAYNAPDAKRPFTVALGDKHATLSIEVKLQMQRLLKEHEALRKLDINDIQYRYQGAHNGALMAFLKGEVDAVVVPEIIFSSVSEQVTNKYPRLTFMGQYPGAIILANPKLSKKELNKMKKGFTGTQGHSLLPINFHAVDEEFKRMLMDMPDFDISECTNREPHTKPLFLISE